MNEQDKNTQKRPMGKPQGRPVPPERPRRPLTEEEKREIMRRRAEAERRRREAEGGRRPPEGARRPMENGESERRKMPRPDPRENVGRRDAEPKKRIQFFEKKPKDPPEPPPRRRNDESYNFSRSLSETHERIMAERRERLEDAKVFRREDVRQKLKYGVIVFCAILILATVITTVAVSCSLSSARVKRGDGEYTFTVGKHEGNAAYKDTAKNGVIYINMNEIAKLCGMTVGGSAGDLRFTVPSGDWVSFRPDNYTATINGYGIKMSAPARLSDTVCHVPLDFIELVMDGIEVTVDENEKKVTVARVEKNDSTPLEPRYVDVFFMLKADIPMNNLDENKYFSDKPLFSFKTDLSEYEQYMNPEGEAANAFLMLLNKQNPVDSDFEPSSLTVIPAELVNPDKSSYVTLDMDFTALKALEAMMKELRAEGFGEIFVTSAYRSYSYQSGLYNRYIEQEMDKDPSLSYEQAKAIVETYSAIPGYSEHHTGLCIDFITTDMVELTNVFAEKEVYDWLCANAWKFGFILRYPEDKIGVTEYDYESWHWRFVGRSHALEMLRSGECFEEYLERINKTAE